MNKKYLMTFFAAFVFSLCIVSCDNSDTDPGATQLVDMAGQWDVAAYSIDASGTVLAKEADTFTLITYNTAANNTTEMWVNDKGNFWNFKMKVNVDLQNMAFSCVDIDYNASDNSDATAVITNGKVLKGAATNLHGAPNDSIVFEVKFSDDTSNKTYRIAGQRYTGFLR